MSTAMAASSSGSTRACRRTKSIAGTSVSACRRPRDERKLASTPSWPPTAHPTWTLALSIPRISTASAFLDPTTDGAAQGLLPWRPALAARRQRDHSIVGGAVDACGRISRAHAEMVRPDARAHDVPPSNDPHGAVVDQLGKADVDDLLHVVEPVDVDVHDRKVAVVLPRQHERRAGHTLTHAQAVRQPLD